MALSADLLNIVMFLTLFAAILAGYPVAFTLAGVSLIFIFIGIGVGSFDASLLSALPQRIFGIMNNEVLIAVPLFVFMGVLLEQSKIAEDFLQSMDKIFSKVHGGLAISVTVVGVLLAASTGIVGATVVTMGLLSLPTMLQRGYNPSFSAGSIAAAGTLGQIIPPSIVLVILGDILATSYQSAQISQGIFSPDTVSIGDLFAGALFPGLLLVGLYIVYQITRAWFFPHTVQKAPRVFEEKPLENKVNHKILWQAFFPLLILMFGVLGSILSGAATPTEAAAIGAVGAIFLASYKLKGNTALSLATLLAIGGLLLLAQGKGYSVLSIKSPWVWLASGLVGVVIYAMAKSLRILWRHNALASTMTNTMHITTMVFTILIGASVFSLAFRGFGGDVVVEEFLSQLPGGTATAILLVMLLMFFMGFFLDFIEICFVVVPIVAPILLTMGVHPVWLGVMIAVNLQTSFLTPPFGFALFYLRGVAPKSIKTVDIYRGVIPFVIIQILLLLLLAIFPELATWLPEKIFG